VRRLRRIPPIRAKAVIFYSFSNTVFFARFFSPKFLKLGFFPVLLLRSESAVASVSVDDVRDVVNVSSSEVPDAKVLKMIKRADAALELEAGRVFSIQI